MDNYFIKIQGKVNVPEMVAIGHNYRLILEGSVTDEKRSDNEDGTFSHTSTFRPILGTVEAQTGKTIKLRDTRSRSSQIRAYIHKIWQDSDDPREQEKAYDATMLYILRNLPELYEKAKEN